MKLEIIKESSYKEKPWYKLRIDGQHIKGSYILDEIMELYELYKNDPNFKKDKETVIVSEEI